MRLLVCSTAFAFAVVACASADPYGDVPVVSTTGTKSAPETKSATCSAPVAGKDPSAMTACTGTKGSKGRCVATASLGSFGAIFEQASCKATEACVPEEVVKQGTNIQLKTCTGVLESEGRCFWPLAKEIVSNYDILKGATKDQCEGEQVCAPCVNPLDKKETGLCSLGGGSGTDNASACEDTAKKADEKPASTSTSATGLAACCGGRGRCVPTDLVPEDSRDQLGADSCTGATPTCAPVEFVPGAGTAKKCTAVFGVVTGICISKCAIESFAEDLIQGDCADDEMCAPCSFLPEGTAACK
jgi:hypothetical protein